MTSPTEDSDGIIINTGGRDHAPVRGVQVDMENAPFWAVRHHPAALTTLSVFDNDENTAVRIARAPDGCSAGPHALRGGE